MGMLRNYYNLVSKTLTHPVGTVSVLDDVLFKICLFCFNAIKLVKNVF